MKDTKKITYRIIFTILSILIISFIFGNSLLDASASTVQSTGVREFLNALIRSFNVSFQFTENFVRKCAHFIEYFILSVSLMLMYGSYLKKHINTLMLTLLTGFCTACIDETIQIFSMGRSAQFSDVILDFSGVLTAACIIFVIVKFKNKRGLKEDE